MRKIIRTAIGTMALTLTMGTTVLADSYTIAKGDTFWKISNKYGISLDNILKANNANANTIIYPGQVITIPDANGNVNNATTNNVTANNTAINNITSKYGEYLSWYGNVDTFVPRGSSFKVIDFYTGKSYMAKRTGGSIHADTDTLTKVDTEIMKSIWGGYSWTRRPAIVEYNGKRIAASVTFMPHAGLDGVQGGVTTNNRSGGYGRGINYDFVKGNGIDGHFDIHFAGSKRHMDNQQDPQHQKMIKIAAGIK